MKPEEVKPAKDVPEYRVDDPATAWEQFETLAKKAMTTSKVPVDSRETKPDLKDEK